MAAGAIYKGERSPQDLEGSVAVAAISVNREVAVEAGSPRHAQPLHHGKARPIDHRKVLVLENIAYGPSYTHIRHCHYLHMNNIFPKALPEIFCATTMMPAVQQQPCFNDY
jgi:hypothetical protein